jgi:hypothetical protein
MFEENLLEPSMIEKKKSALRVKPEALVQIKDHLSTYSAYI